MSSNNNSLEESEHETNGFIFIYEYNNTFLSRLGQIDPVDGTEVVIHPVYYTDYENTMTSEDIVWNDNEKRYISESDDGSWLDTIKDYPDNIFSMDLDHAVFHEDKYYHCDGCLLDHLVGDLELVDIQK